jgi:site-specific DNA-methyltransferase (adenine-specific)
MSEPRKETLADGVEIWLGDCREVMRGFGDGSIDMIWTDPPYGHGNHNGDFNARLNDHRGIESMPIANDDADGMRSMVDGMLNEASRVLKLDRCCCCCCAGGGPRPTFAWVANRMDSGGLSFFHSVIWDKRNPGLGWRYRRQHEMVMISHRKGGRLLWADDKRAVSNVFSLIPPRERAHPNEKPVAMCAHFIELHSTVGQVVCDPFCGSGSTGVAAIQLGRRFVGIECDSTHFDTARRRLCAELSKPRLPFAEFEPSNKTASMFDGDAA